ncbi:hypothetical protein NGC32_08440 [Kluyvera cryocrescens]|uniref:hypothetical protein n=1 Tax=Kluyvera cryocrescens TaxID=580 RepID=UPI002DB9DF6E|nr:hypothetical protein [Kluyvera cryocrescens]MEB7712756.1 hypothetical protein [Kluyvera cryocrescens]
MLFEYALHKDTNKVVHVDAVPNGKRCECICKNCGDALVAKNNGNVIRHHFSHTTKEESRDCKMTQLHIGMQQYFLSVSKFTLPQNSLSLYDTDIFVPEHTADVSKSTLEYKIGKYWADAYLETDVGDVAIEVWVTHECEEEKRQYYIDHQIDSIEYHFPLNENRSVDEWVALLKVNRVDYEWIYQSALEKKKLKHLEKVEQEKQRAKAKRESKVHELVNRSIKDKTLFLPGIHQDIEIEYNGKTHNINREVFAARTVTCQKVMLTFESDDYVILDIVAGARAIRVAYSYSSSIPDLRPPTGIYAICHYFDDESNEIHCSWLKHPPVEANIQTRRDQYILDLVNIDKLRHIKGKVETLASEYSNGYDTFFRANYSVWKEWMIKKRLFTPMYGKKGPSFPQHLKMNRKHEQLWPFQTFHILALSTLAEIIDSYPMNKPIYYRDLFMELTQHYGLSEQYQTILKEFRSLNKSSSFDDLIDEERIIEKSLEPYAMFNLVSLRKNHAIRKGSLVLSLKV